MKFQTQYFAARLLLNVIKNECEFIPRSRECDPMLRIGKHGQAFAKYWPSIGQVSTK